MIPIKQTNTNSRIHITSICLQRFVLLLIDRDFPFGRHWCRFVSGAELFFSSLPYYSSLAHHLRTLALGSQGLSFGKTVSARALLFVFQSVWGAPSAAAKSAVHN